MKNRDINVHVLAESFGFVSRPEADAVELSRYWERATLAIDALPSQLQSGDCEAVAHSLRVIVLACGHLDAQAAQAEAGHLASALGVDLSAVLRAA